MRNLLRIFLVVIFCTTTTGVIAQNYIVVKGGLNLAAFSEKDISGTFSDNYFLRSGYLGGVAFEKNIVSDRYLETGLFLSQKGSIERFEEMEIDQIVYVERDYDLIYLDIPITIKQYLDLKRTIIFIAIGSYIDVGLKGTMKYKETIASFTRTGEVDVDWGYSRKTDDFKRVDFGLLLGGGLEVRKFQLGFNYGFSIWNISPAKPRGTKLTNGVINFSLGYAFKLKEKFK